MVGSFDLGESDRILRLLSPVQGRVSVVARRVRASKRRWGGVFDVGNRVRYRLGRSKGNLASVSEAEAVAVPRRARKELERVALLAYGCEVCASLAPEHHEAQRLHKLLVTWLDVLEGEGALHNGSRIALEAKALTFAGLSPQLVRCARCGLPAEDPLVFDPESGGALHQHCGTGRELSDRWAQVMEGLRRTPLAETPGLAVPPVVAPILADFIEYHLGRAIRSRGLVDELGL